MVSNIRLMCSRAMNNQPQGVGLVLFAEFCDRFAFYGLISLFILYLTKQLHFDDRLAYSVLSVLFALIYILPVLGGLIANYLLGYQRAIIAGGIIMGIGLTVLAASIMHHTLLYPGLALTMIGNSLFQASITSLLGTLYQTDDPRRESGFIYYQICINAGAIAASIVCGGIANYFGAQYGFVFAACGILGGTITFSCLRSRLGTQGQQPIDSQTLWLRWLRKHAVTILTVSLIVSIIPLSQLFLHQNIVKHALFVIGIITTLVIIYLAIERWSTDGKNILAMLPIALCFIAFQSLIRLQAGMLTLFADGYTIRHIGSFSIPTQWFFSLEPLFVILLGGVFAKLWLTLHRRHHSPTSATKFATSFLFMSLAFAVLMLGIHLGTDISRSNSSWLVLSYLLQAASELCLVPIAIALLTRLAPKDLMGLMVGYLYLAIGFGGYASAIIAEFTTAPPAKEALTSAQNFSLYGDVFQEITIAALSIALFIFVIKPWLNYVFNENK